MALDIKRWWLGSRNTDTQLAATLQKVLNLTMGCAVFYPRVADRMGEVDPDPWLRSQLLQWGAMMVCAGDSLASLITELEREPQWSVDCGPDELEPPGFFYAELTRLAKATSLLQEALPLAKEERMRQIISELLADKQAHMQELREVQTKASSVVSQ